MRSLLLAPLILALSSPAFAGLPSNRTEKWVRTNQNWMIDTEDIDLKRSQIRFWVKRNAVPGDFAGNSSNPDWEGKIRMDCKKFRARIETDRDPIWEWTSIKPDHYAYTLANYFCFLTGEEGYTREGDKEFFGIGASIYSDQNTTYPIINDLVKESPAGKSGVKKGDEIISIDGRSVAGMSIKESFQLIEEAEGGKVMMVLQRTNKSGKSNKINLNIKKGKFIVAEPAWVKKIIKTVQAKPISKKSNGSVNCDSPLWRNKPQCIDY